MAITIICTSVSFVSRVRLRIDGIHIGRATFHVHILKNQQKLFRLIRRQNEHPTENGKVDGHFLSSLRIHSWSSASGIDIRNPTNLSCFIFLDPEDIFENVQSIQSSFIIQKFSFPQYLLSFKNACTNQLTRTQYEDPRNNGL